MQSDSLPAYKAMILGVMIRPALMYEAEFWDERLVERTTSTSEYWCGSQPRHCWTAETAHRTRLTAVDWHRTIELQPIINRTAPKHRHSLNRNESREFFTASNYKLHDLKLSLNVVTDRNSYHYDTMWQFYRQYFLMNFTQTSTVPTKLKLLYLVRLYLNYWHWKVF